MRIFPKHKDLVFGLDFSNKSNFLDGSGLGAGIDSEGNSYGYDNGSGHGDGHSYGSGSGNGSGVGRFCSTQGEKAGNGNGLYPTNLLQLW